MKRPIRILLVEDSKDDADLLLWEMRSGGFEPVCRRVETLAEMTVALEEEPWDVIVSDYTMPQFSGLRALELVQKHRPDLPVIIVSGNIGEEIAVEAMRAGASDYVMKSALSRLVPAIERELRENVVRRAGRAAQRELQENEARLRGLVSNIPGMVFQLTRGETSYVFPYVSEGSLALLELTPRQLLDEPKRFFDMLFDDSRQTLERDLARSAGTMVAVNWEGRIQTPVSHTVKWLSLRLSPRQLEGNRVQWEGIMMNISRSKQAEIEINQSRQRLSELSAHLQSAKEQERTKIAREVHDDIGGNLTAIKIDLLWLINRLGNAAPQMLEKARAIEALTDRTMEITSRIAGDLRPPLLELGLLAAIEWEAGEFEKRMEIPCVVALRRGGCRGRARAGERALQHLPRDPHQHLQARPRDRGAGRPRRRGRPGAPVGDRQRPRHPENGSLQGGLVRAARHARARAQPGRRSELQEGARRRDHGQRAPAAR